METLPRKWVRDVVTLTYIWSLGVMDSTKHYECFRKGSSPLETTHPMCDTELGRIIWRVTQVGEGVTLLT